MRQLRIAPHLTTLAEFIKVAAMRQVDDSPTSHNPVEFIQVVAMRQVRTAPHLTTLAEFIQVAAMRQVDDSPTSHNPC